MPAAGEVPGADAGRRGDCLQWLAGGPEGARRRRRDRPVFGDVRQHADRPQRWTQVEELLGRGVGVVAIHWSTGGDDGPSGEWWLERLGGWFSFSFSKFLVRDSRVRKVDSKHPICRGWSDFDFHDEYYTGLKFHRDARPLLVATIDGKEQTIAWTFERPDSHQGRSFGFVCGHFHECFANESFRRSVVNATLWARARCPTGERRVPSMPMTLSCRPTPAPPLSEPERSMRRVTTIPLDQIDELAEG